MKETGGEGFGRVGRRVEEDAQLRRVRHLPGRDQRELVEQALGVLHDADDGLAALGPRVTHPQVELGRQPGGDGDLVRARSGSCPDTSCSIGPP